MIGLEYIRKINLDTVDSLAEKLNVTKGLISQWENEKNPIPQKRLEQLSTLYDVPIEYLNKHLSRIEQLKLHEKMLQSKTTKHLGKYTMIDNDKDGNVIDKVTIDGDESLKRMLEKIQVAIEFEEMIQKIYDMADIKFIDYNSPFDIMIAYLSSNEDNIFFIDEMLSIVESEPHILILSIIRALELSNGDIDSSKIKSNLVRKLIPIFKEWRMERKAKEEAEYQEYKELLDDLLD